MISFQCANEKNLDNSKVFCYINFLSIINKMNSSSGNWLETSSKSGCRFKQSKRRKGHSESYGMISQWKISLVVSRGTYLFRVSGSIPGLSHKVLLSFSGEIKPNRISLVVKRVINRHIVG